MTYYDTIEEDLVDEALRQALARIPPTNAVGKVQKHGS